MNMPYQGNARDIYGSGELLHYVKASKYTFGLPLAGMLLAGVLVWLVDPFLKEKKERKKWMMEMLIIYMPFFLYFAAHSYVWWKGSG